MIIARMTARLYSRVKIIDEILKQIIKYILVLSKRKYNFNNDVQS